ncbi:uncharacterized protein ACIBXB_016480 isoform 1-T1 [Morphnus guianensis]
MAEQGPLTASDSSLRCALCAGPPGKGTDSPYDKTTTTRNHRSWHIVGVINFLTDSSSGLHSTAGGDLVMLNQHCESFCFSPAQNESGALVCYSFRSGQAFFPHLETEHCSASYPEGEPLEEPIFTASKHGYLEYVGMLSLCLLHSASSRVLGCVSKSFKSHRLPQLTRRTWHPMT